ncbi:hypothetical protein BBO99_00002300 [Phytophthora kernoviae]|uniref:START domain-containing protein n=2 Tax=Phytophthora kernoviae TaxID=325452 RepID=A0A421EYM8_9STRA|nr:hypothetical protein G195_002716 [Phytophthora kernoviae 00238/432]KAG2509790.1 hypothetical protein JM16_008652 [Phytophthora kernoviae]RLN10680.1 hypothetical protein BBI17_002166 [Phytophthora kernoviae]RLN83278.1 hypothetical protein BBO99_00002300 [Phytophthora kernoviae]
MRHGPSGTEFYELCLRDLDTIYTQRDEILRGYGLESTGVDWDSPESGWREEGNTGYFTYVDKYVVPFDFEQTCKSMWDLAHMPHRQEDRQSIDKLEGPEKTAAFTFRVTTHLKSGRVVSIQQRAVIRLYKGDGHGVIVWRSFTEGEGMFTGMHSDETGWMVMIPLPSDPEARTLIKTCIHHKPMHFDRVGTQESTVKQYTDAVLDAVREDGVEITTSSTNFPSSGKAKLVLQGTHGGMHTDKWDWKLLFLTSNYNCSTLIDADTEFLASIDSFLASFGLPVFSSIQELFGNDGGEESKTTGAIERSAEAPAKTDSAGPETYAMQSRDETEVQTSADVATKYESLKAMDRKRRNVYRAQKQVEREDLRQQVVELTAELAERQKIAGINNLPPASAWKMVAQLRFQKRLRAEAQRHRLSEAVDARAALVHEFQEFMQQRIAGLSDVRSEDIMSEDSTGYQYERIRLEPSDDEIFRASAQELDIIYAQTDEVFRSCGLNSTDTGWRGCKKKWRENAEKGCFVYENTFVMPFDFQRFYASVWHVVRMPHRQEGRQTYEAVGDRDNTVAMKFRITTRLQSGRNVSRVKGCSLGYMLTRMAGVWPIQ